MPLLISIYLFLNENVYARSLKATADKLGQESHRIALALGTFGLCLAGAYFVVGKQDAGPRATAAFIGLSIILLHQGIIDFVKGLA